MRPSTHRLTVVGTMLCSFLAGLHMPVFHEIIEHGATPRWDVVIVTVLLVLAAIAGGWILLRKSVPRTPRP